MRKAIGFSSAPASTPSGAPSGGDPAALLLTWEPGEGWAAIHLDEPEGPQFRAFAYLGVDRLQHLEPVAGSARNGLLRLRITRSAEQAEAA